MKTTAEYVKVMHINLQSVKKLKMYFQKKTFNLDMQKIRYLFSSNCFQIMKFSFTYILCQI